MSVKVYEGCIVTRNWDKQAKRYRARIKFPGRVEKIYYARYVI